MSEEEIMSLLRAIKEQLNTMETRQVMMNERQRLIKQEVEGQEEGSFGSVDK